MKTPYSRLRLRLQFLARIETRISSVSAITICLTMQCYVENTVKRLKSPSLKRDVVIIFYICNKKSSLAKVQSLPEVEEKLAERLWPLKVHGNDIVWPILYYISLDLKFLFILNSLVDNYIPPIAATFKIFGHLYSLSHLYVTLWRRGQLPSKCVQK